MAFELWPAIDLISGEAVRLTLGKIENKTVYSQNLIGLSEQLSAFANGIHVVDLDGAFAGKVQQFDSIKKIVQSASVPVEVGGGIRSLEEIRKLLELGVRRVILGTSVIHDHVLLTAAIKQFSTERIVIGADIINGCLATHGWQKSSGIKLEKFLRETSDIQTVIVTDVSRDGMLTGPSFELYEILSLAHPDKSIIASGGIHDIEDLKKLRRRGMAGAVFGKAYYEGKLTHAELMQFQAEPC